MESQSLRNSAKKGKRHYDFFYRNFITFHEVPLTHLPPLPLFSVTQHHEKRYFFDEFLFAVQLT